MSDPKWQVSDNVHASPVALDEEAISRPNHFSVDGTLIEAVASIKSSRRREDQGGPPDDDPATRGWTLADYDQIQGYCCKVFIY